MDSKPMKAHLCSAVCPLRSAVAAAVPLARHCCTRCRLPPSAASSRRQAALSGNSGRANKPRPVLPAASARSARMAAASRSGDTCVACISRAKEFSPTPRAELARSLEVTEQTSCLSLCWGIRKYL